ncbi:MAG: AAA family ATPase [Candidatus Sulfotelmatobacter sp.]
MPLMIDVGVGNSLIMFKGEPGTRKSTTALSYPKPQYWFSYDKKMSSLLIPMRNWNIDKKDVEFDDYNDWNKAKAKLEKFQINCNMSDGRKIATIVLDSITTMGDAVNQQTLNTKKGTTRKDGSDAGKMIGGIQINSLEDYNAETAAFQELLALVTDIISYHKTVSVILIAHVLQTEYKNSANGESTFSRTIVTGGKKAAAKIPAYCTEIYHFQSSSTISGGAQGFKAFTMHTGDDFARTAIPLASVIEFKAEPFYDTVILPAIDKLRNGKVF